MSVYFIGVDVGSGSARAGVFNSLGHKVGEAKRDTQTYKPQAHFVEQSSQDIWHSVCLAVKDAIAQANIEPIQVKGIGFDATCSLVVLDKQGQPLTVSPTGRHEQNIIMWMDHRAIQQAERINATDHPVLAFVGNRISPEMETPKLLWLKENMPTTWNQAGYFFDLPDFLTWRATNTNSRALCSTVCKWTYLGHEQKWDKSYFEQIGLGDLLEQDAHKIGSTILPMGQPVGHGLTAQAAMELGLVKGTPVATSIIDAHAGGIGVLGAAGMSGENADFNKRLALIGGTSSCHMTVSKVARFIDGIWGAYYSAMIPDYWLNEAGQSATGALIDHVIEAHPFCQQAMQQAQAQQITVYQLLNDHLAQLAGNKQDIAYLTKNRHVLPYFHGNRSPRANPHLTGTMTGLTMNKTLEDMALQYLAPFKPLL
ncbi:FGGY-family carbohydrate kinase [Shewanella marina]|uniref:FGGY-family carbohydrate kinase n=1 Tax=Shewanella marina TaxID=487319 RepID=UPI000B26E8D3|nr:FGGY-family carbohydrate kinase [Shewanella marina]